MELWTWRRWCKVVLFMAVVALVNSSCKKEDEPIILPDYAGTWVAVESIAAEDGNTQIKSIFTLTANSFSDLEQIHSGPDRWTDLMSRKGTLAVYKNTMVVHITEIGLTSYSLVTGLPTGVITSYPKGSSEFEVLMYQLGLGLRLDAKYTVSGNTLTFQNDINYDGDYLDELETSVFTKQ